MTPWDDCGWTRSRYFSFIRSALRKATVRYPAKQRYLNARCRPAPNKGRYRFVTDCELCGAVIGKSKAEVDHIIPAGSLRSYEDLPGFVERLFCGEDNFQILCSECHEVKTLADKRGITMEEAVVEKEVITFSKLSVQEQRRVLSKRGVKEESMNNQENRVNAYREALNG